MTMVREPSTQEEESDLRKSTETRGSLEISSTPFMGPSQAFWKAALTSSAVMPFFSALMTRSTTETLGVGTRRAIPLSLPLREGSTRETAEAAPVVVGGVQQALVASVGVGGRHGPLDDAELLLEDLHEGREAVGGARGVGDDVGRAVVLALVHAHDVGGDRPGLVLGGRGDDDLLGAGKHLQAPGASRKTPVPSMTMS